MTRLRNKVSGEVTTRTACSSWRSDRYATADHSGVSLPLRGQLYLRLKRVADWTAALAMLVGVAPLLLTLALLIKITSDGPIFYSQCRLGQSGKLFRIYKLRTMYHNCEAATGPVWSTANDPRVTSVGRWLRDTHLDELPQLLNILRGEMSLIGPRPERPEIANRIEQTLPQFSHRLRVKPGMSGLSQMRMPADTDLGAVERKLANDLEYVRHIGLAMDARVALSTIFYLMGSIARAASRQLVQRRGTAESSGFTATVQTIDSSPINTPTSLQTRAA